MDLKKKQSFNRRMSKTKYPRHQNLANGGVVKYFDEGGVASNAGTTLYAPGMSPNAPGAGGVNAAPANTGFNILDNYQAGAANIQDGTNVGQLNAAYSGAQNGLMGQQQFANQAAAQGGFGNQSNILGQQQALAGQLQNLANGQGPNPAQAALNQATGQNVSNQAALMAGQRGASANAGLLARQAAQQGAATQQQAVGQGATLQAQQQIAAQAALANQQAQMQSVAANQIAAQGQGATNLSSAAQNEQNVLQGANTSYNNANVGMQSNINNVNSQTSASNQNTSNNILGGMTGMASGSSVLSALAKGGEVKRMADGGEVDTGSFQGSTPEQSSSLNIPNTPSLPEGGNPYAPSKSGGGGGGAAGLLAMFADGGLASPSLSAPTSAPQSFAGQWFNSNAAEPGGPSIPSTASNPVGPNPYASTGSKDKKQKDTSDSNSEGTTSATKGYGVGSKAMAGGPGDAGGPALSADTVFAAKGGKIYHRNYFHEYFSGGGMSGRDVDAVVSPKEVYLNPSQVKEVVERGADPIKIGHHFPGKDNVHRDSLKNDVIKTKLKEGGVVLPIHITTHKDASNRGRKFVERAVAKHMKRPSGD